MNDQFRLYNDGRMRILGIILLGVMIAWVFGVTGCSGRKMTVGLEVRPEERSGSVTVTTEPAERSPGRLWTSPETLTFPHLRLGSIPFDFDRATLRMEVLPALAHHAMLVREYQGIHLRIEGHCDERGTTEYNLALGHRRAQVAAGYFLRYGIPRSRLTTMSYGEERPVDPQQTEAAWAQNRRAEFHVEWGE